MLFRLIADVTFEATGIDDAFVRLASHFGLLGDPELAHDAELEPLQIESGRIDIAPTDTIPED